MAFATRSTPRWTTGDGGGSRAFSVNLPSTIDAGDLLIAIFGMDDGNGSGVLPSGPSDSTSDAWSSLIATSTNVNRTGAAWYKIADGDEDSGSLSGNWTGSFSSEDWIGGVLRITNWHGTTPPEATSWAARTNDSTPAVPTLNPSGWDIEDTLWIPALISNLDTSGITGPSGYTFNATEGQDWEQALSGGSGLPALSVASLESAAASEGGVDWGAATNWDGTVDHLSAMIAVRPAAAPTNPAIAHRLRHHYGRY